MSQKPGGGKITIRRVSKIYRDPQNREVTALSPIDLEIEPGEFISLIGPSGCGKSTLLRLIAGLEKVTTGQLLLDGEAITGAHHSRGFVFQNPTLFPWKTIWENVAVGLEARGVLNERRAEVDEFLELVGLKGFGEAYPHQLSGGMAQRASLARALINHPKVLLMDEPLGALDAFTRMNMQEEILRIWKERQTTIIFVTHDIDEAVYLSDRVVVMSPRPGRIKEVMEIPTGRPRARNTPDFFHYRTALMESLHLAEEGPQLSYYL